jgi:hypothetical protein
MKVPGRRTRSGLERYAFVPQTHITDAKRKPNLPKYRQSDYEELQTLLPHDRPSQLNLVRCFGREERQNSLFLKVKERTIRHLLTQHGNPR